MTSEPSYLLGALAPQAMHNSSCMYVSICNLLTSNCSLLQILSQISAELFLKPQPIQAVRLSVVGYAVVQCFVTKRAIQTREGDPRPASYVWPNVNGIVLILYAVILFKSSYLVKGLFPDQETWECYSLHLPTRLKRFHLSLILFSSSLLLELGSQLNSECCFLFPISFFSC